MVEMMSEKKGRDFKCPSTSSPHHVCTDFCYEKMSEKLQVVGNEPELLEYPVQNKEMTKVHRKGATPTSLKAVKPFNSCAGNFFSTNPRERAKKIWVITERSDVHPDCKNATNPYHKCADYCFKKFPNGDQPGQDMKLNNQEGEKIFSSSGSISLQSQCPPNLQDECTNFFIKNGPDSNTREGENPMDDSTNYQKSEEMLPQKALNPREEIKTSVASKSELKLECRNANPHDIYNESCFHSQPEDQDLEAMAIAKEEKELVPKPQREMNSSCENVSNSYIEYCFKNVPEKNQLGLAATKSEEENKIALYRESLVNPECQFKSNPYHTCAEYCFQKAPERERRGLVMTLRSIKKILSLREKANVKPQCKFASNPYHECDSDCFQNELDQSKAPEGWLKLSVCNSPSEKRDDLIMEKCTANLEFVEPAKPIYNNVESCVETIFPDQILTNSEDSSLVEESIPDSDYTDFSEGIIMEVVAKDLMRDAQPFLLDASGLFLEWAKYCSQENEAEDKIFMQVERRAFDTRNGQGNDNLKCNDPSTKRLQSSLPTYVLFFLGFLFALFKWVKVIHSIVMSSERKSSERLMHKRPFKSK